jgi:hypothetical protein
MEKRWQDDGGDMYYQYEHLGSSLSFAFQTMPFRGDQLLW